jgi:hypothetical protein
MGPGGSDTGEGVGEEVESGAFGSGEIEPAPPPLPPAEQELPAEPPDHGDSDGGEIIEPITHWVLRA